MNRKESHLLIKWLPAFILLSALLACNISQAVTPTLPSGSGQNNPPTAISGQNNPPTAVSVETSTATAKPVQPTNTETPTNVPIVHKLIASRATGWKLERDHGSEYVGVCHPEADQRGGQLCHQPV